MLTLLAVGVEVSTALRCNQPLLLALYVFSGWCGGFLAARLSPHEHVGASGSVSGVIVALSVLRPNSAVHVLGDVNASNPLMLLGGTLLADLSAARAESERRVGPPWTPSLVRAGRASVSRGRRTSAAESRDARSRGRSDSLARAEINVM